MRLAGLSWRALLGIGLVLAVFWGISLALVVAELEDSRDRALDAELRRQARYLELLVGTGWTQRDEPRLTQAISLLTDAQIDVVIARADGVILLDTTQALTHAAAFFALPEVREAMASGSGTSTRRGVRHGMQSRALALRLDQLSEPPLLVWLSRPAWRLANDRPTLYRVLAAAAIGAGGSLAALSLGLLYRRTRLLRQVTRAARSLAEGDLSLRADVPGSDEWAGLAQALNETRRRLLADAQTIDQQRRTLEALLNQLAEGVIVVRRDGRIAWINPAAMHLLNLYPSDQADCGRLVGQPIEQCVQRHELLSLLPTAQAQAGQPAGAGAGAVSAATPVRQTRLEVETSTGTIHLLVRVSPLVLPQVDHGGDTQSGWLLVVTDITELGRALQLQSDFVANASHELRTPLASIRAAVETLLDLDLAGEAEEAARFLNIIDRHSQRLQAMVTDLLELSRLDSRPASFAPERYRLADICQGVEQEFSEALRGRGLYWECHYRPGPEAPVVVNGHLLRLALDNLVDNAIKFTEPGGRVRLTCERGADWAAFEVADTGCGIPPAEQARVFERFYQVERARSGSERGTGLGLAIVHEAVAAMGGTVSLESEPGRGTRVTVRIPQARPNP